MASFTALNRTFIKHSIPLFRFQTSNNFEKDVCRPCRQKFHYFSKTSKITSCHRDNLRNRVNETHFKGSLLSRRGMSQETPASSNTEKRAVATEAGKSSPSKGSQTEPPSSSHVIETASESRMINPAASKEAKLYYFDTLGLANKFQNQGFTQQQATCIVEAFIEVLNTSIEHQSKNMVTKPQQEIMVQQLMGHIGSVKKDMVILEKSEFTMLRNETEKQTAEIKQMKSILKDEISKLQGNVKLDINLERSRAKEAHAENEKQLQILRNKIDTDVANLRTVFEQNKNDLLKFASGTIVSCIVIALGVVRLMK